MRKCVTWVSIVPLKVVVDGKQLKGIERFERPVCCPSSIKL